MDNLLSVSVPYVSTKRIKITRYSDGRKKVQISSNLLRLIGLDEGTAVVERCLESGGYVIERADLNGNAIRLKPKKVYEREYKRRRNNPFETVLETTSKRILDSVGDCCQYVHVTLLWGRVIVKGIVDKLANRISRFLQSENKLSVFAASSSGVDAHAAQSQGFEIVSGLDFRPQEKRDKKDFTETGMMSFLHNIGGLKHFFNEDIYQASPECIHHITESARSNVLLVSLQCDDLTPVKAKKLKQKSVKDLSSTLDMLVPYLGLIERLQFPIVVTENVKGFGDSMLGDVWDLQLRRKGYHTYQAVLDARDYGGHTSRVRYFHIATSLDAPFSFPEPIEPSEQSVWRKFIEGNLDRFRDVSSSKSIQDGARCGRLRTIDAVKSHSPTLLKSQLRMAKDSVVIDCGEGKYLFPDEKLMSDLMGIPESFSYEINSSSISSEIIGQAVDYDLYQALMHSVKRHIEDFIGK